MKKEFLPNPDTKRESIVPECDGCNRIFSDDQPNPEKGLKDTCKKVCIPYMSPKAKWRLHKTGELTKKVKGNDEKFLIHFNPCVMATHVSHYVEYHDSKGRVGQQKQKRK